MAQAARYAGYRRGWFVAIPLPTKSNTHLLHFRPLPRPPSRQRLYAPPLIPSRLVVLYWPRMPPRLAPNPSRVPRHTPLPNLPSRQRRVSSSVPGLPGLPPRLVQDPGGVLPCCVSGCHCRISPSQGEAAAGTNLGSGPFLRSRGRWSARGAPGGIPHSTLWPSQAR